MPLPKHKQKAAFPWKAAFFVVVGGGTFWCRRRFLLSGKEPTALPRTATADFLIDLV
jgi:hypothetical protein